MPTLADTPGRLVRHHSLIDPGGWSWPHFSPREISCRHCGELYVHAPTLDYLERLRADLGHRPLRLNSAHRCRRHNAAIGGAPRSRHLRLALDLPIGARDPLSFVRAVERAGGRGIGLYRTFIHVDLGRRRRWYGSRSARAMWQILEGEQA